MGNEKETVRRPSDIIRGLDTEYERLRANNEVIEQLRPQLEVMAKTAKDLMLIAGNLSLGMAIEKLDAAEQRMTSKIDAIVDIQEDITALKCRIDDAGKFMRGVEKRLKVVEELAKKASEPATTEDEEPAEDVASEVDEEQNGSESATRQTENTSLF